MTKRPAFTKSLWVPFLAAWFRRRWQLENLMLRLFGKWGKKDYFLAAWTNLVLCKFSTFFCSTRKLPMFGIHWKHRGCLWRKMFKSYQLQNQKILKGQKYFKVIIEPTSNKKYIFDKFYTKVVKSKSCLYKPPYVEQTWHKMLVV